MEHAKFSTVTESVADKKDFKILVRVVVLSLTKISEAFLSETDSKR